MLLSYLFVWVIEDSLLLQKSVGCCVLGWAQTTLMWLRGLGCVTCWVWCTNTSHLYMYAKVCVALCPECMYFWLAVDFGWSPVCGHWYPPGCVLKVVTLLHRCWLCQNYPENREEKDLLGQPRRLEHKGYLSLGKAGFELFNLYWQR